MDTSNVVLLKDLYRGPPDDSGSVVIGEIIGVCLLARRSREKARRWLIRARSPLKGLLQPRQLIDSKSEYQSWAPLLG